MSSENTYKGYFSRLGSSHPTKEYKEFEKKIQEGSDFVDEWDFIE